MDMISTRTRSLPAPPWVVFDDLCQPSRPLQRQWLELGDDEVAPTIIESSRPDEVIWSSLWSVRPDARVHYELFRAGYETDLRWTLYVESPTPDDVLTRRMSKRLSDLVFANLRYTYGQ